MRRRGALIILTLWLCADSVGAVCFNHEPTTMARSVVGEQSTQGTRLGQAGLSESQCEANCRGMVACRSYVFNETHETYEGHVRFVNNCYLFGELTQTQTERTFEMVKCTNEADCAAIYPINRDYVRNPALAAAQLMPDVPRKPRLSCSNGKLMDIILENGTHQVHGNGMVSLLWDTQKRSWYYLKETDEGLIRLNIKAAGCYIIDPSKFADTSSCGGKLPVARYGVVGQFSADGPVLRYGVHNFCPRGDSKFQFTSDFRIQPWTWVCETTYISCIDKSWFWLKDNSEKTELGTIFKIQDGAGTCV